MSIFSVFKDKSFEKLINQFDTTFTNIPSNTSTDTSDSLAGQAINQAIMSVDSDTDIHSLFDSLTVSNDRLSRYSTYNELFSAVQLIKRIVVLYLNNLCQRDPITNDILILKSTEESTDTGTEIEYRAFCHDLITFFNLEDRIRSRTASDVLKFGDAFIEVIDLETVNISTDFPRPTENKTKNKIESITEEEFLKKLNSKNGYVKIDNTDISYLLDNYIEFTNGITEGDLNLIEEKETIKLSENPYNFSRILLKFHKPHNVIPLITEYDNVLGYIEVAESSIPNSSVRSNNLIHFANIINQISTSSYIGGDTKVEKQENTLKLFVDNIILKILNKYEIKNTKTSKFNTQKEYSEYLKSTLKPDIFHTLKRLLINVNENALFSKKLKVRYISVDNMFHFRNPGSGTYFPYGDSIVDTLIFPGKLYLLTQLSNAVTRLSRSSVMRKWTIETGAREDVNGLLQKLKRNLKNQRVTGDDIATSKNLPKILSDYKDMVTFKKKNQTFIDLDVLNTGDPRVNIQDLEDLRRELIALSGVPSSYLGYQDMADLKDQVINANIVFANEISAIQKNFNDNLTNLADRISDIVKFKPSNKVKENIKVSLIPPTALVLQNIESSINSISTIQRIFAEIPEIDVDPMYLLKRYSPMIDWNEFEKEAQDFKQRKKVSSSTGDTNAMGNTYGGGGY